MSVVSSIIIHIGMMDRAWMERGVLTDRLFLPLSLDGFGGDKVPQWYMYGAAINRLQWSVFKDWLETLPWTRPELVMVIISGEDDIRPAIWTMNPCTRTLERQMGPVCL